MKVACDGCGSRPHRLTVYDTETVDVALCDDCQDALMVFSLYLNAPPLLQAALREGRLWREEARGRRAAEENP